MDLQELFDTPSTRPLGTVAVEPADRWHDSVHPRVRKMMTDGADPNAVAAELQKFLASL